MSVVNTISERARKHRDAQINALGRLESFKALLEEVKDETERIRARMHAALLDKSMMASDLQRQADYERGFVDGMHYVTVSVIKRAERGMQRDQPLTDEPEEDRWAAR